MLYLELITLTFQGASGIINYTQGVVRFAHSTLD